jgi:hypothetical protein
MTYADKVLIFGAFLVIIQIVSSYLINYFTNRAIFRALISICTKMGMTPSECKEILEKER